MTTGTILVVCTGNICRSPVGAGLLRHHLAAQRLVISSAGTHAVVGRRPVPEAITTVLELTGDELQGPATQITPSLTDSADLILTMTMEQRAAVTTLSPHSVRHTFTLLEFARVTELLAPAESHATLAELVRVCTPMRRLANTAETSLDIADPYGGPPAGYVQSFALITAAVRRISAAVAGRLDAGRERAVAAGVPTVLDEFGRSRPCETDAIDARDLPSAPQCPR